MKTTKLSIFLTLILFTVSCGNTIDRKVDNLDNFVNKVEANEQTYTEADWQMSDEEFERLCAEIEANYDSMTPEQQKAAMKAIGKYHGMRTREGIDSAFDEAKKAIEKLPAILEGFGEGLNK